MPLTAQFGVDLLVTTRSFPLDRCLGGGDVLGLLRVALEHGTGKGNYWCVSTLELQLASKQVRRVVRSMVGFISVKAFTAESAWNRVVAREHEAVEPMGVPGLRISRVTWDDPARSPGDVVWPACLQELIFGDDFNQPIESVLWPSSLQSQAFGVEFNQPVERVKWPMSLKQLTFGQYFNHPVEGVSWRLSLEKLTLGHDLDRPIEGLACPSSLEELAFMGRFDECVETVAGRLLYDRLLLVPGSTDPLKGSLGLHPCG